MTELLNANQLVEQVAKIKEEQEKTEQEATATNEAVETSVEESKPTETKTNEESVEQIESKTETSTDSTVNEQETKTNNEQEELSEEQLKEFAASNNIPKSIGLDVVKEWKKLPEQVKTSLNKLATDADRFAEKYKEQLTRENKRNEILGEGRAYLKHTAKMANISEDQVIANVVSWVAAVEDNPDQVLNNTIGTQLQVKDPITLINTIMQRYGLSQEQLTQPRSYDERSKIEYQIREQANRRQQARAESYKEISSEDKDMEERVAAVEEFFSLHPEAISVQNDPDLIRLVNLEASSGDKSYTEALESAYSFYQSYKGAKTAPKVQENVVKPATVDINKKIQATSLKSTPSSESVTETSTKFNYDPNSVGKSIRDLKRMVSSMRNSD
jgi:antitoxin component HigA of HigAB toxin-antitoxin module